jgi:Uma2 family endonuclease
MSPIVNKLSLQEFLDSPESGDRNELVEGEIIPKVSPKYKHANVQGRLYQFIDDWCTQQQCGRVLPEWAVVLHRRGQDWLPVPDLTYISYERLPLTWEEDAPCPVTPELVIEIISPGQSFGEAESWGERSPSPKLFKKMTSKATDYLLAGANRVWIVDNQAPSITVFGANELPQIYWINDTISDGLLPGLAIALSNLFAKKY